MVSFLRKFWKRIVGAVALILSLWFLADQFANHRRALVHSEFYDGMLSPILAMSLVYGASILLAIYGWGRCIFTGALARKNSLQLIEVYGLANLGKYLPGSIFHLAGRQVLGKQSGWTHKSVAAASTVELVLHILVSSTLVFVLILIAPGGLQILIDVAEQEPGLSFAIALGLFVIFFVGIVFMTSGRRSWFDWQLLPDRQSVFIAAGLQAIFFALMAGIFVYGLTVMDGSIRDHWQTTGLAGIYLLAWVIGLVVPGAPAGLAVREAVFVALADKIGGDLGQNVDLMLAICVVMRIVTTLGEVWLAVFAGFIKTTNKR